MLKTRGKGQMGLVTLRLLAEKSTVEVLRELTDGPLRPKELGLRLPNVAHSTLVERLAGLVGMGAVTRERVVELSPRAYYSLTSAGRALLEIPDVAARWERQRVEVEAHLREQAQLSAPPRLPQPTAAAHMTPGAVPAGR